MKKKKKMKWSNLFFLSFGFLCFVSLLYALFHILEWNIDYQKIEQVSNEILDITEVLEVEQQPEIIGSDKENAPSSFELLKQRLIQVDFQELKKMNADTVGWITVPDTKIHYPFVQTTNNDFYLNHAFDKSNNGAGWVFLDYRNQLQEQNRNLILYAHGGSNSALFGDLKTMLTQQWLQNPNHFVIKLSTEQENTLWQIFSVYQVPTTSDYLQIHFPSDEDFVKFAENLKNRSIFDFNTSVDGQDQILTLSTCSGSDKKIVVHAKLIKRDTRN